MNCSYCTALARYLVDGAGGRYRACDEHLTKAQRAAGVPRSTTRIDGGLLDLIGGEGR